MKKEDGTSVWLLENGESWTPTDVHSETSHNTLMALAFKCVEKYKQYDHEKNLQLMKNLLKVLEIHRKDV